MHKYYCSQSNFIMSDLLYPIHTDITSDFSYISVTCCAKISTTLNEKGKAEHTQNTRRYLHSEMRMMIGTIYHNYHRPALISIIIFPGLLPKILHPSSQERACPTRTYACLAKHNSK